MGNSSIGMRQSSRNSTPKQFRVEQALLSESRWRHVYAHSNRSADTQWGNRQRTATRIAEIYLSSAVIVLVLPRTRTVAYHFGGFAVTWQWHVTSERVIEWNSYDLFLGPRKNSYDLFLGPRKKFAMQLEWLRVAREIRCPGPHDFEECCVVCDAPQELIFAGHLAKAQSQRTKPTFFPPKWRNRLKFCSFERYLFFLLHLRSSWFQVKCSACTAEMELCWKHQESIK